LETKAERRGEGQLARRASEAFFLAGASG